MTDQVTTPARLSHDAGLAEMREYLLRLDTWLQAREPVADGSALTKFVTGESMVNAGLLSYRTGASGVPTTDELVPGEASTSPADESQPTPASGLTVTPGVGFFFLEIDKPTYTQGGGNGRTVIYAANYSGAGPLPTFANAVEVGMFPAKGVIQVIDSEPGVQTHFWVKAETRHPTLQANPTGGTNGVYAASDLINGDDHLDNLSVGTAKIADLAVSSAKIANLAVTTAKIDLLAVQSAQIDDLAVGTIKIANNAVTVPAGASLAADSSAGGAEQTLLSVYVDSEGQPIYASWTALVQSTGGGGDITIRGKIFGTVTTVVECPLTDGGLYGFSQTVHGSMYVASPGTGSIEIRLTFEFSGSGTVICAQDNTTLFAIGTKR